MTIYAAVSYRPGRSGWLKPITDIIELSRDYRHLLDEDWFDYRDVPELDLWFQTQRAHFQPNFHSLYDWSEEEYRLFPTLESAESHVL